MTVAAPPSGSSDLVTTPRFVGYYRDLKINGAILRVVHSIDVFTNEHRTPAWCTYSDYVPPVVTETQTTNSPSRRLIPGAYERDTLTHREPGSMGGAPFGAADLPVGPPTMSRTTVAERQKDGGGGPSQRPRPSNST